jgi:hypothetical protein
MCIACNADVERFWNLVVILLLVIMIVVPPGKRLLVIGLLTGLWILYLAPLWWPRGEYGFRPVQEKKEFSSSTGLCFERTRSW